MWSLTDPNSNSFHQFRSWTCFMISDWRIPSRGITDSQPGDSTRGISDPFTCPKLTTSRFSLFGMSSKLIQYTRLVGWGLRASIIFKLSISGSEWISEVYQFDAELPDWLNQFEIELKSTQLKRRSGGARFLRHIEVSATIWSQNIVRCIILISENSNAAETNYSHDQENSRTRKHELFCDLKEFFKQSGAMMSSCIDYWVILWFSNLIDRPQRLWSSKSSIENQCRILRQTYGLSATLASNYDKLNSRYFNVRFNKIMII